MLAWVDALKRPPRRTFLVHGEEEEREELERLLTERGHTVELPVVGETVTLKEDGVTVQRRPGREPGAPARMAVPESAALGASARSMSSLLRELQALRKAWHTNGPHLPPDQANLLAKRAEEVLRSVQDLRHLIDSADK